MGFPDQQKSWPVPLIKGVLKLHKRLDKKLVSLRKS